MFNLETDPEKLQAIQKKFDSMDKTILYVSEYGAFNILTFWTKETKAFKAGWAYRVVDSSENMNPIVKSIQEKEGLSLNVNVEFVSK